MIEGWEEKTLKEITTILGDGLHGTPKYTIDGEYYFINGNNLDNGKIIFKNKTKRVSVDEYEKYKKPLNDRTVFVSINGTLGNVAFYNNEKIMLGKSACYFNLIEEVDKEFIKYFIQNPSLYKYLHTAATGATIKNVSLKTMRGLKIHLPPLKEQKQIVTTLDKTFKQIDQAKANLEKNLNNAKELFQSKLNEVFSQRGEGWEEKKLGDIASVEYGFTAKSTVEGTMRYVRITDIDKKGNLILDEKKYIENTEESQKFQLKDNDILMARTGATFAKVLLYKDYEPSVFASYLIRIHFNENISNELYWYFSKSQFYWSQANSLSSGSAQPHFNGKALKEVIFSYPKSEKKQKELIIEFKSLLDEIEKLQTHYQQKLNNLEELKKSILQKAFRGELG